MLYSPIKTVNDVYEKNNKSREIKITKVVNNIIKMHNMHKNDYKLMNKYVIVHGHS